MRADMSVPAHSIPHAANAAFGSRWSQADSVALSRPGAFYRPELDGLRFFAFLAVYVHHTATFGTQGTHHNLPDWLGNALGSIGESGAFGVDFFFVLSAYLVTELLLRERDLRGAVDVRAFYVRRMLRIWPLYFVYLLVARALAYVVPGERLPWLHVLAYALFSGNWAYTLAPVPTVAGPLWSVSVEEQFYILWPLAMRRAPLRRMAVIAVGIVAVGIAIRIALGIHGLNDPWVQKNSFARIDGLAAGILLAVALHGRSAPQIAPWVRWCMLAGAVATLVAIGHSFNLIHGPPLVWRMALGWPLAAAASAVILVAVLGDSGPIGWLLRLGPVVYLGRISYGLYIWHQVGLLAVAQYFPHHTAASKDWIGHFVVGLPVTVALAALSYRFVEQPFLRLKAQRFTIIRSAPEAYPAHAP
jgi:peptidoglycan/LPS O-acetylase OafA/YrhL